MKGTITLAKLVIEDEWHAEQHGEFSDLAQAMADLERRVELAWDEPPNLAPCTNWQTCGRAYYLVEYDDADEPWKEVTRTKVLEVTASGVKWMNK